MTVIREVSQTGGMKERKDAELASAPADALLELARVYGYGAQKYGAHNYRRGYPISLSLNAMWRHVLAFQGGEDLDPDSRLSHMAHAAWHCLNMIQTLLDHPQYDDRWRECDEVEVDWSHREPESPPNKGATWGYRQEVAL